MHPVDDGASKFGISPTHLMEDHFHKAAAAMCLPACLPIAP